jgi:hypothetical protein
MVRDVRARHRAGEGSVGGYDRLLQGRRPGADGRSDALQGGGRVGRLAPLARHATGASRRDGTVTIAFVVDDVDEVIRWALGYGGEDWISGPPAVVDRARVTLA